MARFTKGLQVASVPRVSAIFDAETVINLS